MTAFPKVIVQVATTADDLGPAMLDAADQTALWTFWMAIGTFGLLIGALAAAWFARRTMLAAVGQLLALKTQNLALSDQLALVGGQLALQQKQFDSDSADRRQREVSRVSSWFEPGHEDRSVLVLLENFNESAVYDVTIEVWVHRCAPDSPLLVYIFHQGIVGPNTRKSWQLGSGLPPRSMEAFDAYKALFVATHVVPIWSGDDQSNGIAIEMKVRDSTGTSWKRSHAGFISGE